ncbi:MAG: hypothetical protein IT214_09110 [Chitinophagaceae bacterium]|nr:hypothetical protein [Chitinophagaceae bacterium]
MDTKKTIRNILFTAIWLMIGGGMLTLLVAAIGKKNKELCKGISITVKGDPGHAFIQKDDILQLLVEDNHVKITGQALSAVDLHSLERTLEKNVWIKDAQLYFDNKNVLHLAVSEREPVARIFSTGNKSFYIDNSAKKLPLSERAVAEVPVFTGYPDKISKSKDSILLRQVKNIAAFILTNSFWMSQVAQISVTDDQEFEMTPAVGNHTVELGDGENVEEKFGRLMIFYKDVLSKTGFNKYATIDVRFSGQVVAIKGKQMTKVDSVQLRKNVERLMLQAQQMQSDTSFTTGQNIDKPLMTKDTLEENGERQEIKKEKVKAKYPKPVKAPLKPITVEKAKKPKAVMTGKN